jgi:iodotyrosine deiodinase
VTAPAFEPLAGYHEYPPDEMRRRAAAFYADVRRRRTVREFADRPVPREVIEDCLRAAGTAPSGANMQPWRVLVVTDPALERQIREAAEAEERRFYRERAPREWLDALAPLGTDEHKPFLETAPYPIVVFAQSYGLLPDGRRLKAYDVQESVGIATGLLIAAVHHAGLVSLSHTPSPMGFLGRLPRPARQRAALPDPGRRLPCRGRPGPPDHQDAARGDRRLPVGPVAPASPEGGRRPAWRRPPAPGLRPPTRPPAAPAGPAPGAAVPPPPAPRPAGAPPP